METFKDAYELAIYRYTSNRQIKEYIRNGYTTAAKHLKNEMKRFLSNRYNGYQKKIVPPQKTTPAPNDYPLPNSQRLSEWLNNL